MLDHKQDLVNTEAVVVIAIELPLVVCVVLKCGKECFADRCDAEVETSFETGLVTI